MPATQLGKDFLTLNSLLRNDPTLSPHFLNSLLVGPDVTQPKPSSLNYLNELVTYEPLSSSIPYFLPSSYLSRLLEIFLSFLPYSFHVLFLLHFLTLSFSLYLPVLPHLLISSDPPVYINLNCQYLIKLLFCYRDGLVSFILEPNYVSINTICFFYLVLIMFDYTCL